MALPVMGGRITSNFNDNRGTHYHSGVDLAVPVGTRCVSLYGGTVQIADSVGWSTTYGKYVKVELQSMKNGKMVKISELFGHLSRVDVSKGQLIMAGAQIGLTGNTGFSTGPHLHYELRIDGKLVNPLNYSSDVISVADQATTSDNKDLTGNDDTFIYNLVYPISKFVTSGFIYIAIVVLIVFALLRVYKVNLGGVI